MGHLSWNQQMCGNSLLQRNSLKLNGPLTTFRRQEQGHPAWSTLHLTLYCEGLSAMLFKCVNTNYHSNENCHTKVVGVPRTVDKVLPVSIYSNHMLLTLLIELFKSFQYWPLAMTITVLFSIFLLLSILYSQASGGFVVRQNSRRRIT